MHTQRRQRALILPVVLLMLGLLALMMAGFVFFVRAEGEGIRAFADGQQARLAAWLGPLAGATPVARLRVQGSDAVVHLFRKDRTDIYAAYKLAGEEVVQLRLRASTARVLRRGQPPKTARAEGGVFLVSLDTVPTFISARRAAWAGQP